MKRDRVLPRQPDTIGARIRAARNSAGLAQDELAYRAGVEQSTVSKYERGVYTPTSDVLRRIAVVLGVRVEDFQRGPLS